MKSHTVCACAIAMLLVSTVAFGEIVSDGDYTEDEYGSGSATGNSGMSFLIGYADGDDNYGWGYGEGWQSSYTTVADYLEWEAYIYVWTEAHLWLWSGDNCSAYAYGEASIDNSPGGTDDVSWSSLVQESGYEGEHVFDYNEPETNTLSGTYPFPATYGVSTQHEGVALGSVKDGAHNTAYAMADIRAWCSMSEP